MFFTGLGIVLCSVIFFLFVFISMEKAGKRKFPEKNCKIV